jgi:hypothetical protein
LQRRQGASARSALVSDAGPVDEAPRAAKETEAEGAVLSPEESAPAKTVAGVPIKETSVSAETEKLAPAPDENDAVGSSGPAAVLTPTTNLEPNASNTPIHSEASGEGPSQASEPPSKRKPIVSTKRKKAHRDDQMSLFEQQPVPGQTRTKPAANAPAKEHAVEAPCVRAVEPIAPSGGAAPNEPEKPKEDKPAPVRPLPASPPVNPAQLRTAVNQILPLLTDQDPGAKDCLKDNRATFRSAFAPEAYLEFEQFVKSGGFGEALEHLKRAAKKHGISV